MRDIKIKRRNFEVRRGERQAGFSEEKSVNRVSSEAFQNAERSTVETAGRRFSGEYYDEKSTSSVEDFMGKSEYKNPPRSRNSIKFPSNSLHRAISSPSQQKGKKLSQTRKISGAVIMLVGMILLFLLTDLTSVDIFFWLFFFAMFWYKLDSRISIAGALIGLVVIMLLSAGQGFGWWKTDNLQEQIAVAVYFFLVIGVLKQIWEYKMESKVHKVESL